MYKIKVAGQLFSYKPVGTSVAESVNTEFVEFVFDETWNGLVRYACFKNNKVDREYHILLNETNMCVVPWEVLAVPGMLYIGALGTAEDGTVVQPTIWVQVSKVVEGVSPEGDIAQDATPSAIMQITALAGQALRAAQAAEQTATKNLRAGEAEDSLEQLTSDNETGEEQPIASGVGATALGKYTRAAGMYSCAVNYNVKASGDCSFACGTGGEASGSSSSVGGLSCKASGKYSYAWGDNCDAEGLSSHAEGTNSRALGAHSHAEGYGTSADGQYAHTEGLRCQSMGASGHAEGVDTFNGPIAQAAHAEGQETRAEGVAAHAEGYRTAAIGSYAHAEGNATEATANISHAEGYNSKATAGYTHAEGYSTTASGLSAHTEGNGSKASGNSAHAEGLNTEASGNYSHAGGWGTKAIGVAETAIGRFNRTYANALFNVGCGTSNSDTNSIFVVFEDGIQIGTTFVTEAQIMALLKLI